MASKVLLESDSIMTEEILFFMSCNFMYFKAALLASSELKTDVYAGNFS